MFEQLTRARSLIAIYWMFFWLLNGLDKFFNYQYFFGENRHQQFIKYFASLDLPASFAVFTVYAFGVMETLLGLVFVFIVSHGEKNPGINRFAFKATMAVWIIFSIGDILFGARGELREHGIYMILTILSFQFFLLTDDNNSTSSDRTH
jgi:hypothetical protein